MIYDFSFPLIVSLLFILGGQVKTGCFKMATVKLSHLGAYNTKAKQTEHFLLLGDVILDVGADQLRSPKKLQNGKVDVEDMNVQQFAAYQAETALKNTVVDDQVKSLASSNKRRRSSIINNDAIDLEVCYL